MSPQFIPNDQQMCCKVSQAAVFLPAKQQSEANMRSVIHGVQGALSAQAWRANRNLESSSTRWYKTEPKTLLLVLRMNADLKADKTDFKGKEEQVADICGIQCIW